jgi:hypothetical protein
VSDTKYRFPIKVSGFIEMEAESFVKDGEVRHQTRVVVDVFEWEFSGWPRVSPYGDDDTVVQIDDGASRRIEADANVVVPLREFATNEVYEYAPWEISRKVEKEITDGTV